jgi:GT2 family glycosyltransferase
VKIAVIVVNWNSGVFLKRCLQSLEVQRRQPDRVIVVDCASSDDSLQIADRELSLFQLTRLRENVGFARGNNIAAAAAMDCDALALLNPDAFADPEWLSALEAAAKAAPDVSAFASQMRFDARPEYLDGAGDSYHVAGRAWRNGHGSLANTWTSSTDVFAPCAAAALYRRNAFDDVGGFDESYFCYFEDVDLGFRLRLKGHRCIYVPAAIVNHVSSGLTGYRSDFAVYHGERNMVWTFAKDMPARLLWRYLPQHLALNLAALLWAPTSRQGLVVLRAKIDAIRGLAAAVRQRRVIQGHRTVDVRALQKAFATGVLTPYVRRYDLPR